MTQPPINNAHVAEGCEQFSDDVVAANKMPQYIGTKIINAHPFNRGDWCKFRGWDIPANENPADEGYIVEYTDGGKPNVVGYKGYVSWSPKEQFENAYRLANGMSFGLAIEALKKGLKVARTGWNGKGLFLYYVPANKYPASRNLLNTMAGVFEDDMVPYQDYIAMKTVQNTVVPWLASQTDMLSDDWQIIS